MGRTFLDRFRKAPVAQPAPVFAGLAEVRAYWEALRSPGRLPDRLALDPRGLAGVLDRVFLAERIGAGLAQVRIAGSALAEFAGLDPRGLPLSCLFASESRDSLARTLEQVFAAPAIAELDLGSDRGRQDQVIARLLLLPLSVEGQRQQVLGMLGFAPGTRRRCKLQVLARREERLDLAPVPTPAPAVEPAPARPQPILRRGHLALVHSDA